MHVHGLNVNDQNAHGGVMIESSHRQEQHHMKLWDSFLRVPSTPLCLQLVFLFPVRVGHAKPFRPTIWTSDPGRGKGLPRESEKQKGEWATEMGLGPIDETDIALYPLPLNFYSS